MVANVIGKVVSGIESNNPDDAWSTFWIVLRQELKWCRGYKYWRTPPTLMEDKRFDTGENIYCVRARITACMLPIPGAKRALVKKR